jgi:hypothetical protein
MISRRLIEDRPVTRMWRRTEVNFVYRGIIGGDSTHQINIWRRGKKHVAVFDCELPVSRTRRIRREMLLAEDFSLLKGPHDRHPNQFVIDRAKPRHEASATGVCVASLPRTPIPAAALAFETREPI